MRLTVTCASYHLSHLLTMQESGYFFFLVSHLESIVLIFIHFLWGILVTIIKF
jgi:hypothetical protein